MSAPLSDRAPASRVVRCGLRVLLWSLAVAVAYGLVAGGATSLQFEWGLGRFSGYEYVPRVIGLSALRGWGPWGAAMVPALTTVVVLHRIGRRSAEVPLIDRRLPLFAGSAVPLIYPLVVTFGCLAGLLLWCAHSGCTVYLFVTGLTNVVLRADVAYGVIATAIYALLVGIGVRLASTPLLSRRWRLVTKLLVVWVALQVLAYPVGYLGR